MAAATPTVTRSTHRTSSQCLAVARRPRDLHRTKNFLDNVINRVPATIIVKDAINLRHVLVNKNDGDYLRHSSEADMTLVAARTDEALARLKRSGDRFSEMTPDLDRFKPAA